MVVELFFLGGCCFCVSVVVGGGGVECEFCKKGISLMCIWFACRLLDFWSLGFFFGFFAI